MATDLGTKNSQRRKDLYSQVIDPLNQSAQKMGLTAPFGRDAWLDAAATGSGNRTQKWKQVKELARDLSDLLGLDFKMAISMSTFGKAKSVAQRIKEEANSQVGADNVDAAADKAAQAGDVPLLDPGTALPVGGGVALDDPSSWGFPTTPSIPGGGAMNVPILGSPLPEGSPAAAGLGMATKIGIGVGAAAVVTGLTALAVRWARSRRAA